MPAVLVRVDTNLFENSGYDRHGDTYQQDDVHRNNYHNPFLFWRHGLLHPLALRGLFGLPGFHRGLASGTKCDCNGLFLRHPWVTFHLLGDVFRDCLLAVAFFEWHSALFQRVENRQPVQV